MGLLQRLRDWFHLPGTQRLILRLLETNGPQFGLDLVHSSPKIWRGTVYVHLASLEEAGYVRGLKTKDGRRLYRITPVGKLQIRD